ncbi:MAG: replication restart helicase PriA [Alphaproteobacteria bacterium]
MEKNNFAQVLVPQAFDHPFDYRIPEDSTISRGSFVRIPFGRRSVIGVVWSLSKDCSFDPAKVKQIEEVFPIPPLIEAHLQFIEWVAKYTMSPLGNALKMSLSAPDVFEPSKRKRIIAFKEPDINFQTVNLTAQQKIAVKALCQNIQKETHPVTVLDGVVGSGKTEVYFEALAETLKQGKQVLVLLPEIALSSQWYKRFEKRFGAQAGMWHSDVTKATKRETWKALATGKLQVVVGARSALFLPFQNLGLIIVDEEHENSYKQEEGVPYHARDMAVLRGALEKVPVILASATPSLESLSNVEKKKYEVLHLSDRFGEAVLPEVKIIDLRHDAPEKGTWIAPPLVEAMQKNIEKGEQSLLFLNRRGYAPLTLCRACGHRFECPTCTAWLVEHKHRNGTSGFLHCHHCDHHLPLPELCPSCEGEETLVACGPGVERLAEEAQILFPTARIGMMDSDHISSPKALAVFIEQVEKKEIDILIGTQMVAKGHHFPDLTIVGIVDADMGLAGSDLRALEKSYQVLHQVAGRAGRAEKPGTVFLQTYLAEHPIMTALASWDRDRFVAEEINARKAHNFPPYGKLAALIISGKNENTLDGFCRALSRKAPHLDKIQILGPAPAPLSLLRGKYRRRFLIKAPENTKIQPILKAWLSTLKLPSSIKIKIDIDPYNFM